MISNWENKEKKFNGYILKYMKGIVRFNSTKLFNWPILKYV